MAAGIARAAVILEFGALAARQPRVRVEMVGAVLLPGLLQDLAVEPLGHIHGGACVAAVEHREGVEAQLAQPGRIGGEGRHAAGEVLAALRELAGARGLGGSAGPGALRGVDAAARDLQAHDRGGEQGNQQPAHAA